MGVTVKHAFVNPKLDGPDPTITRPSDWNAAHVITGDGFMIAGQVIDYLGHTIPAYLLEAYGQSVAAATYPLLFAAMVKQATITLTTGSPGTVNWTGHGLPINSKVRFRTTGALPTGIVVNTDYFIISAGYTANSFRIAATVGGAAIDLTGSQSGVHTGINAQYGVSNDLSTFSVPDLRGRVTAGLDTMGGTAAGRLTGLLGGVSGLAVGNVGGAESHVLTLAQSAAHTHLNDPPDPTINFSGLTVTVNSGGAHTHTVTGNVDSAGAHTHTVTGNVDSGGTHTHTVNTATGVTGSAGAHTPAGTVGNESAHTHGPGSLTTDVAANHQHGPGSLTGGTSSNSVAGNSASNFSGGGSKVGLIPVGGDAEILYAHNHSVSVTGGITAAAGAHGHAVNGGATGVGSAHTHSFTGTPVAAHTHTVAIDNGGAHTHVFSAGAAASAGAHTHTFSSGLAASGGSHTHTATAGGTITSAQADYATGAAGGDAAHNNVQPTFVLRKLVYVG